MRGTPTQHAAAALPDVRSTDTPTRVRSLDALRGIAVLMVLGFHYSVRLPIDNPGMPTLPWQLTWGEDGVQLFFAISGFVILLSLARTVTAYDFIRARFLRLYPAYWAGMVVTGLIVWLAGAERFMLDPLHWLVNLTMLQSWFDVRSVDGVYWSLIVELCFYVIMLAIWRVGATRHLPVIVAGWLLLHPLWAWMPSLSWKIGHALIVEQLPWFAIGMAAWMHRSGQLGRWQALALGGYAILLAGLADPRAFLVGSVIGLVFVLLESGWLGWLAITPLLWLGDISYPLYLVHQYAGFIFIERLLANGLPLGPAIAITAATVMLIAWAIRATVEQPVLQWARQARRARRSKLVPA